MNTNVTVVDLMKFARDPNARCVDKIDQVNLLSREHVHAKKEICPGLYRSGKRHKASSTLNSASQVNKKSCDNRDPEITTLPYKGTTME